MKYKVTLNKRTYEVEVEEGKAIGITDGTRPQQYATRQEVVAMVMRAIRMLKGG